MVRGGYYLKYLKYLKAGESLITIYTSFIPRPASVVAPSSVGSVQTAVTQPAITERLRR